MSLSVVGIEIDEVALLISLVVLDEISVLFVSEHLVVSVLEEGEVLGTLIERLIGQHTIVDENLERIPFLLIVLTVILEDTIKAVCHLLGDIGGNLLHVSIALKVRTAHVERNIWRVYHAMKEGEEVWYDAFHLVGDEHLIAVELYLIALQVDMALHTREVKDTRQMEREIHIEVNPEERLVLHRVEGAVE